ncbi:MAG TPA: endopeptidase La [Ktedonobacterales bacterium]|nr:endopeptidase La [Ktedonobacterales bacterium]
MENRHRPRRGPRTLRSVASQAVRPRLLGGAPGGVERADGAVRQLPVLPVRNTVVLPDMVVPLFLDRDPAQRAIEAAMASDRALFIVAQLSDAVEDPTFHDVYNVGTECTITRMLRMPDGATSILVQGVQRITVDRWCQHVPFGVIVGTAHAEPAVSDERLEALVRTTLDLFKRCTSLSQQLTEDAYIQALNIDRPGALADFVVAQLEPPIPVRQQLLETLDPALRLKQACQLLRRELSVLELEHQIHDEVQREADRGQREFFLREQLKAIHKELGEYDPGMAEAAQLRHRVEMSGMPADVQAQALKELDRLQAMPAMAPEQSVVRTYLDWLIAVPWRTRTADNLDLRHVARLLDERHYGLDKVKDRILEFIAIRKLAPQGRTPILCLVGPPGVGKTSLGRSIADALGRRLARISLGGVRDEAEIRGHRRTYVGALPGRVIQAMKSAGTVNPVLLLDEVDKLASDYRGDSSAALLEVLDPEQNATFSDHYLDVPYDLSGVMFVVTANVLHPIPAPLRDRMEVIEVPSYTEEEKVQIARSFLVPRQMRECGLTPARVTIDDEALRRITREYTYEAGVRGLEREIAAIMRRVARRVAEGRRQAASVTVQRVPAYLGQQRHFPPEAEERDEIGVAMGLAWTAAGGDLTPVEVMAVPGRGTLTLTGQLGDVMRESAQAALTFSRSRAGRLGLSPTFSERNDIHIHLPAGAIPKDGPSAGVTMAVAMISALTERAVRRDVAMTGEITLRGRVLPVGGVREKVLAAYRAGISTVLLPSRNVKDLDEVAPDIRERMGFIPVESMDEVLDVALAPRPAKLADRTQDIAGPPTRRSMRSAPRHPDALQVPTRVPRPRMRRAIVVAQQ